MNRFSETKKVTLIPIDSINVLNPRARNQKVFLEIAENIKQVGMKRPITVMPSQSGVNGKTYNLVCGQGRLEAFIAHGQKQIPAIVIDADEEQALIMSLVENLARRKHKSIDLLYGIELMRKRGHSAKSIALKTGNSINYVYKLIKLMDAGEERLLAAVESGSIPISLAMRVATSPIEEQNALQEAYESNQLRGKKFLMAKRLLELRKRSGKTFRNNKNRKIKKDESIEAKDIVKVYQKEVDRKRLFTRKAEIVNRSLIFVTEALRRLLKDDHFMTLLRAENISTMPVALLEMLDEENIS